MTGVMTFLSVFWNNYTAGPKMFAACAGDSLFFGRRISRTVTMLNLILTKVKNNLSLQNVVGKIKERG